MTESPSEETALPEKQGDRLFWALFVAGSIAATAAVALLMNPSGSGCIGEILWLLVLLLLPVGVPLGVYRIAMSPPGLQGWPLFAGVVLILAWALLEFVLLVFALYAVIVCM
jgi:hypothetical protein